MRSAWGFLDFAEQRCENKVSSVLPVPSELSLLVSFCPRVRDSLVELLVHLVSLTLSGHFLGLLATCFTLPPQLMMDDALDLSYPTSRTVKNKSIWLIVYRW